MENGKKTMKHRISSALIALMAKKSYMDITITDIVNKAQIARASFYRNFSGIAEVLDFVIDDMFERVLENIIPVIVSNDVMHWRILLRTHFERVEQHKGYLDRMKNRNLSAVFSRMDQRATAYEQSLDSLGVREKYIIGAKLGLLTGVTKCWIKGGMKESVDEMIDFLLSIIMF